MANTARVLTKKSSEPKKPAAIVPVRPSYALMISSAIKAMKERNGSSRQVILKYIIANYNITDDTKAQVYAKLAIRKMLDEKKLIQVKGSFKLPKEEKAAKPKQVNDPTKKKPVAKKLAKKASKKLAITPAKNRATKKLALKENVAMNALFPKGFTFRGLEVSFAVRSLIF